MYIKSTSNLCTLPPEYQAAIQLDKERWLMAYKMFKKPRVEIITWLATIDDEADMRRRLNIIMGKKHERDSGRYS